MTHKDSINELLHIGDYLQLCAYLHANFPNERSKQLWREYCNADINLEEKLKVEILDRVEWVFNEIKDRKPF